MNNNWPQPASQTQSIMKQWINTITQQRLRPPSQYATFSGSHPAPHGGPSTQAPILRRPLVFTMEQKFRRETFSHTLLSQKLGLGMEVS